MEEYTQITLDEWTQWKEDIRIKLAETANNFVYIGYRLKQIRDSGMFGGAADVFEFAQNEYGLGKSTVSRFIAINEKYSEGGNSLELKEEFRNFSSSKLSEMLTLPDNEVQMITEKTTIRAIRELKKFDAEDSETVQEEERAAGVKEGPEWTPLEKCLIDFFKIRKEMLNDVMECLEMDAPEYKQASELMTPSGQGFHKKGIVFMFLYEWSEGIKYKLMTEAEPVSMNWPDFLNVIYGIYGTCDTTNVWEDFYGNELEKESAEKTTDAQSNQGAEPVATSQQKEEIDTEESHEEKTETATPKPIEQETSEGGSVKDTEKPVESVSDVGTTGDAESEKRVSETVQEMDGDGRTAATTDTADSWGSQGEQMPEQMTVDDCSEMLPTNYKEIKEETKKHYEEIIEQLTEKTAQQAEKISEALHEGRKELGEYRKIRGWVSILAADLEQLTKFVDLATPEEDEEVTLK